VSTTKAPKPGRHKKSVASGKFGIASGAPLAIIGVFLLATQKLQDPFFCLFSIRPPFSKGIKRTFPNKFTLLFTYHYNPSLLWFLFLPAKINA